MDFRALKSFAQTQIAFGYFCYSLSVIQLHFQGSPKDFSWIQGYKYLKKFPFWNVEPWFNQNFPFYPHLLSMLPFLPLLKQTLNIFTHLSFVSPLFHPQHIALTSSLLMASHFTSSLSMSLASLPSRPLSTPLATSPFFPQGCSRCRLPLFLKDVLVFMIFK